MSTQLQFDPTKFKFKIGFQNKIFWGLIILIVIIVLVLDYVKTTRLEQPTVGIQLPTPTQYEQAYNKVVDSSAQHDAAVDQARITVEKGKLLVRPNYNLEQAVRKWNERSEDPSQNSAAHEVHP